MGRRVVGRLVGWGGVRVRVLSRDPGRAAGVGGEVVAGDFADPGGLRAALAGADAFFLVTSHPMRPEHDVNALAAARACGVRQVVKLSALAVTDPGADDLLTRWQRDNEDRLTASGLDWTLLRPRAFMTNALAWADSVRSEGVVRALYGDGRNAGVDPEDIAEVAARVLTEAGHEGRAYALTGPRALSAREQTERLGHVLGRSLRFVELGEEEALAGWRARLPEPVAQALLHSARRLRDGAKAQVAEDVEAVTGRPPRDFEEWAVEHAAAFRP
ncbi:NAD(P)-dependent oxidoreductase [Streptomyces mangrovisoli]|uniref:NAD(P)-dependent oxidoreductase n=1 Tax=Streptomyces mangrovisoli TaxID=1428628 RepID=A0A1J4NZX5_9ACTN|nr:NAD(P)-dependent oxidoreductase [Streptomyces mangrovisoli]